MVICDLKGGGNLDFKIKISCEDCRCSFELRPFDFKLRDSLECPNCGQQFPSDEFIQLKTGITALGSVPERTPEPQGANPFDDKTHRFKLSVEGYHVVTDVLGLD